MKIADSKIADRTQNRYKKVKNMAKQMEYNYYENLT
jgi:hypothetical protein